MDSAAFHHVSVDPRARKLSEISQVSPVVLGNCPKDTGVMGEFALSQRSIDATRTRNGNAQDDFIADRNGPPRPGVLNVCFPV